MPYSRGVLIETLFEHTDHPEKNRPEAEQALGQWVESAAKAWPFRLDPNYFCRHIAHCLSRAGEAPEQEPWTILQGVDLYLACACLAKDDTAVETLKAKFGPELDKALGKLRLDAARVDDIKQVVWMRILTPQPSGKPPKLALYTGSGPLKYWLRSVSTRTALNQLRKRNREFPMEDEALLSRVTTTEEDPELAYLKEHYREKFRTAFARAIEQLDKKSKTILRYHHIDGLSIDDIGRIYDVHRVTAYRWLDKARTGLSHQVEGILRKDLGVSDKEFDSIVRLVRSRLALSITKHLGETPE